MRRVDPVQLGNPLVSDDHVSSRASVRSESDSCRREHDAVGVTGTRVGELLVERKPSLEATAKLALVLRERPPAPPNAGPRRIDVDVEEHDEGGELVE